MSGGVRPSVTTPPPWTPEQTEAAALSAQVLDHLMAEVSSAITTAHGHGLAVPPKVPDAVAVLQALAYAWKANAAGEPIPEALRAVLVP